MPTKAETLPLTDHWQQHIEAWQASGLTQQAYCKANDLSYHRFGYWRRKLRQQPGKRKHRKQTGFVPVACTPQSVLTDLTLTLPNGVVIRGIASGNVPVVCQLLEQLP